MTGLADVLRRQHGLDNAGLHDNASIVLSKADYDNLVAIARYYGMFHPFLWFL